MVTSRVGDEETPQRSAENRRPGLEEKIRIEEGEKRGRGDDKRRRSGDEEKEELETRRPGGGDRR